MNYIIRKIRSSIFAKRNEEIITISLIACILYPMMSILILTFFNKINFGDFGKPVLYLILFLLVMPGVFSMLICNFKFVLKSVIIFLLIVFINYFFNFEQFSITYKIIAKFFISCYIPFLLAYSLNIKKNLLSIFNTCGSISILLFLIYIILMFFNFEIILEKGQSISFIFGLFLPIKLVSSIENKNKKNFFEFMFMFIIIFLLGSRTIFLSMLMFILMVSIYKIIIFIKNITNKNKKIFILFILFTIFVICAIVIINIKDIAKVLYEYLLNQGKYNRFLRLISEGQFFKYSTGRLDIIYPKVLNALKNFNLIWGHGIAADRILLYNIKGLPGDSYLPGSVYSHNIILEVLYCYGIIGLSMFISLFGWLLHNSLHSKNKLIIVCLLFSCFIPLFLVSSILVFRPFWILIGILISNVNIVKMERGKSK